MLPQAPSSHNNSTWLVPPCQRTLCACAADSCLVAGSEEFLRTCISLDASAWSTHPHLTTLQHAPGQQGVTCNDPHATAAALCLRTSPRRSVLTSMVPCRSRGTRREPDHPSGHSGRDLQRGSRHHDDRSRDLGRHDDRRPSRRDERTHDDRNRRPHGREHSGRDKRKREDEVRSVSFLLRYRTTTILSRQLDRHKVLWLCEGR